MSARDELSGGSPRIEVTAEFVRIAWAAGSAEFSSLWLRDNVPANRDVHSGQRRVDIVDLPERPRIAAARIDAARLCVTWTDEPDGAAFELSWLAAAAGIGAHSALPAQRPPKPILWPNGAALDARRDFAWATPGALREEPRQRAEWLAALLRFGLAFLREVPCTAAALTDVMAWVGSICETNYGRVFDVRSVPQPENLAYSDLGLGLHTDNPYREPVPGFQALHALKTAADGGVSLFADGFAFAEALRAADPATFDVLTRTVVPFRYRSADADLYAERPLIQLDCLGAVAAVHYNSRSIAPLRTTGRAGDAFYAAYRRFALGLREPWRLLTLHLCDGDLVVFDNQRILHGRTAVASAHHGRHLRGCYLTRDSVYSTAAMLERTLRPEA